MKNTHDFTIDEYEESTKEFEKYVNAIPKKVQLRRTKPNNLSSLIKEFSEGIEFTESEEIFMLDSVLKIVKKWGKADSNNDLGSNCNHIPRENCKSYTQKYFDMHKK